MAQLLITHVRYEASHGAPCWIWDVDNPCVYRDCREWHTHNRHIDVEREWLAEYERKTNGASGYRADCGFAMALRLSAFPPVVRLWIKQHNPELWTELVTTMRARMAELEERQRARAEAAAAEAERQALRLRKREEKAAAALRRQRERIERLHRKNNEHQLVLFG